MTQIKNRLLLMIFFNIVSFVVALIKGNTLFMSIIYSLFLGGFYIFYIFLTENILLGIGIIIIYYLLVLIARSLDCEKSLDGEELWD